MKAHICQVEHVIWLLELILEDLLAYLPPSQETAIELSGMAILHFLLLSKFILADQVVDLPPRKLPSSGEEWQLYMSFYYESYIGR